MTKLEEMLKILENVPGIRVTTRPHTEKNVGKRGDHINVDCERTGKSLAWCYIPLHEPGFHLCNKVDFIVTHILTEWTHTCRRGDKGNNYLTVAIDLLSAYRDEVNK